MGTDQYGQSGQDKAGGTVKLRVRRQREQTSGEENEKSPPLVGDVQQYGGFYKQGVEDANQVCNVKIRNGQNGRVKSELWVMSQANLDLGIFQETKIIDGVYTCGSAGYSVIAKDTPSRQRDGVAVFYRESPRFTVDSIQNFGPDIASFQLVTGERQWFIIGCYPPPYNASVIQSVVAALRGFPQRSELMVAGDFNAELAPPDGDRNNEQIAVDLTAAKLQNTLSHFLPQRRLQCQDGRTWIMVRLGRELQSRMYYILVTYFRLFRNVSVWEPMHNSYH